MNGIVRNLTALTAMLLSSSFAVAQDKSVSFMSFTFAEEANKPTVQAVLDGFTEAESVAVEPLGYAWGDMQQNIFLRYRSNTMPNVVQLQERWLPTFADLPTLVDLNSVYGKEALEAAFAPDALALGNINGKQLALPVISGSIGMVANRQVLEKAGVAEIPETVAEFKQALIAVRDKIPNSVPYTMATKGNGSIQVDFMLWNWVHGGRIIDETGKVVIDTAESRAALQFMVDLMNERLSAPEIDRPDARRLMGQGASAFYFDAPQTRTFLRDFSGQGEAFDANVLPMKTPVLKDGDASTSVQWGHLLAVFADGGTAMANDPAAEFVSYLTSDAVQTQYPIKLSAIPVTKSARAEVADDAYLTAWAEATGASRQNEVGIWQNAAVLVQVIGEEVQGALLGQKSADDAISAMQTRLEEAMAALPTP